MSFTIPQNEQLINIKLTDEGRHQLSLGNLRFSKMVLSDREIDYSIDYSNNYSIERNRILSPKDSQPNIDAINLDGSNAINLNRSNISSLKQFITGTTNDYGFFSGSPNSWSFLNSMQINRATLAYVGQSWGDNLLIYTGPYPDPGDLIFCFWLPPQFGTFSILTSYPLIPNDAPFNTLVYKVLSADSTNIFVDRSIPDFTGTGAHGMLTAFYPGNGLENYYGSGSTQNTTCWNLNIVRTYDVAGTNINTQGISGFSQYGSIEYAGTKNYFGFSSDTPAVGFVHYTNEYAINTFGEQLIEKTTELHMPTVMWHKITGYTNGNAQNWGLSCYDRYGITKYDPIAKSTYRDLRDGVSSGNTIVGRVYHKLKMFVITDQELLTALSYKSNRSYTYPEPIVELVSNPSNNTPYYSVSGLCESGKTYFITLLYENDAYSSSSSFGYPASLHCGYIKKIIGENDMNGRPKFLKIRFPANGFPYMRSDSGLSSFGSGWNANTVQVLVNEQPNEYGYDIASTPATGWTRVSDIALGGNGVYRASDFGDNTIDPTKLNSHEFIISRQDYASGSTYILNSGLTSNQNILNFGDESFFYGVVRAQTIKTKYYSSIVGYVLPNELNSSLNPTFNLNYNDCTYISEISVLDNNGNVVAVGKPTSPLKKEQNRILAVQLLLEF